MPFIKKSRRYLRILSIFCLWAGLWGGVSHAGEEARVYTRAIRSGKAGSIDFAFMHYREILRSYPHSQFTEQAIFAHAEYYFIMADYVKSEEMFKQFLRDFPESDGKLFAFAYLLKIARVNNDAQAARNLEKQIVTFQRLSLVFREKKTYQYRSPLYRLLTATFYIDKIEFDAQGTLFAKIVY